jgi:hypothetical protein
MIDQYIQRGWEKRGISPAPPADDAEFLRRVWLDLAGKLPPPSTVREFLVDGMQNKREAVIDELLSSPDYSTNFAAFWRDVMIPEAPLDGQFQQILPSFDLWLQQHLDRQTPFDQIVAEIVATPLTIPRPLNPQNREPPVPSAAPFFAVKQVSPENLAAAVSRAFLGIRVECAQCHDHPFDRWKQREFWGFASFFGGLQRQGNGVTSPLREVFDRREMMIPDTQTTVQAVYLDGTVPDWRPREGARRTLARWIVSPENPYFARATANRLWGLLLGYGLVDPIDDFSQHNPPSHPELLDELAKRFLEQGFDLKLLIRAITMSRPYQLTSRQTDRTQEHARAFARMPVRGLSLHQARQVLVQATGMNPEQNDLTRLFGSDRPAPPEQQIGILWALAMMNGAGTKAATTPATAPVLNSILRSNPEGADRIEALYLTTLSRFPTADERERLQAHIDHSTPSKRDAAAADILWVLINSSEFLANH